MAINYIRTLTLTLDPETTPAGTAFEATCQGTNMALIPEVEGGETVTTHCGVVDIPGKTKHTLHYEGLQDWGAEDGSVCEVIHEAWARGADPDEATSDLIDYELTVGSHTRTGQCRPNVDVEFGGEAGGALTFTVDMPCTGTPTDGTVTP